MEKIIKYQVAMLWLILSAPAWAQIEFQNAFIQEGSTKSYARYNTAADAKIFWWNIAGERFSAKAPAVLATRLRRHKKKYQKKLAYWKKMGALRGNLLAHVQQDEPDLIILSEVPERIVPELEQLFPSYPFSESIPYFPGSRSQILILSRLSLTPVYQDQMSINPSHFADRQKRRANESFWNSKRIQTRNFTVFEVQSPKTSFYLAPLHLVNPWPAYAEIYRNGNYPGASKLSYLKVANHQMLKGEITSNKQGETIYNPLQNQLNNFLEIIKSLQYHQAPLIVLGDFNSPTRILPYGYPKLLAPNLLVPAKGHRLISQVLTPAFYGKFQNVHTIPTLTGGEGKPKVRIDKAFLSDSLVANKMWIYRYSGSDHYPIQIDIQTKTP